MNVPKKITIIALLGIMGPLAAMETKVDHAKVAEQKAAALAVAEARARSADAKSSAAAGASKSVAKITTLREALEADVTLAEAEMPSALLGLIADYAKVDSLEHMQRFPALFNNRRFQGYYADPLQRASVLSGNRMALFYQHDCRPVVLIDGSGAVLPNGMVISIVDTITGRQVREFEVLKGSGCRVFSASATSDGKHCVVVGKRPFSVEERKVLTAEGQADDIGEYTLEVWDTEARVEERSLVFSHTKIKEIFTGLHNASVLRNGLVAIELQNVKGVVLLWDAINSKSVALKGHTDYVTMLRTDDDCFQLVTGSLDGTIRIWDFAGNQLNVVTTAHPVVDIHLARNGTMIVRYENTLQIINPSTGKCSLELPLDERNWPLSDEFDWTLLKDMLLLNPTEESLQGWYGWVRRFYAQPGEGDTAAQLKLNLRNNMVKFSQNCSQVFNINSRMFLQEDYFWSTYGKERMFIRTRKGGILYTLDEKACSELAALSSYDDVDELLAGLDLYTQVPVTLYKDNKPDARLIELYNNLPSVMKENIRGFYNLQIAGKAITATQVAKA